MFRQVYYRLIIWFPRELSIDLDCDKDTISKMQEIVLKHQLGTFLKEMKGKTWKTTKQKQTKTPANPTSSLPNFLSSWHSEWRNSHPNSVSKRSLMMASKSWAFLICWPRTERLGRSKRFRSHEERWICRRGKRKTNEFRKHLLQKGPRPCSGAWLCKRKTYPRKSSQAFSQNLHCSHLSPPKWTRKLVRVCVHTGSYQLQWQREE